MTSIKVRCPAKINLDLKVTGKRPDGFHNIESTMQTISLYDILTISVIDSDTNEMHLEGNSKEIPYDTTNLVHKAATLFLKTIKTTPKTVLIYIDKKIPISAGLAGGSTDAAGTLYGLNELTDRPLTETQLHELCAKLGSDLNVCLKGGCLKTSGRGEIITPAEYKEFNVSLIKPLNFGISAKEAYTKFSEKIKKGESDRSKYVNDLEWAVIDDYPELHHIKDEYPNAVMTGSGSVYFMINEDFNENETGYQVINGLTAIRHGVEIME